MQPLAALLARRGLWSQNYLCGGHLLSEYIPYSRIYIMEGQILLEDISFRMTCHQSMSCMSFFV